ncbi:hypothetical protein ABL78_3852 [Leptomonas seymouri]|uniref:Uncharacterized protein n=1 Tax=Leptomonas seymouri TaxID=5684 RepID=A0A0N1HZ16_LEPSE|nr:hypothetical protein ABL78_3852 [Leptomonas seymouri]|eukprot:KPI87090.1 hypothetical protein ABL78_3852 [Leptomonas seymouri]
MSDRMDILVKRADRAEEELAAARRCEEAAACRSADLVAEMRSDYEARVEEVLKVTREIVVARGALVAALSKCVEVESAHGSDLLALAVRNEATDAEIAVAREELRLAKERYFAVDAVAGDEVDEAHNTHWEAVIEALSRELVEVKERLKTVQVVNRMLRDKFRSDFRCSF